MWLVQMHEQRDSYCMLQVPTLPKMAMSMLLDVFEELQDPLGGVEARTKFGEASKRLRTWTCTRTGLRDHEATVQREDGTEFASCPWKRARLCQRSIQVLAKQ